MSWEDFPGGTVDKNLPADTGDMVWSLILGDSTFHRATKPAYLNYSSPCAYSLCSVTRESTAIRSPYTAIKRSFRSLKLEKACTHQWRPNTTKNLKNGLRNYHHFQIWRFLSKKEELLKGCMLSWKKMENRIRRTSWSVDPGVQEANTFYDLCHDFTDIRKFEYKAMRLR